MTALARYEKLECVGRYIEAPGRASREVIVSLGKASLTIFDPADVPIAHWPIGSLARAEDGDARLAVTPDPDAGERLLIDDEAMAEAVRTVSPHLRARRRRWARRLLWASALAAALLLVFGAAALAPRILETIAAATPLSARAALGDAAIDRFAAGRVCDQPETQRALDRLGARLGLAPGDLVAVDAPAPPGAPALAAPGGRVVIFRSTVRSAPDPLALARDVAAALAGAERHPPAAEALAETGFAGLIDAAAGAEPGSDLVEAAARLLREGRPAPDAPAGAERIGALGLGQGDALLAPEVWAAIRRACEL